MLHSELPSPLTYYGIEPCNNLDVPMWLSSTVGHGLCCFFCAFELINNQKQYTSYMYQQNYVKVTECIHNSSKTICNILYYWQSTLAYISTQGVNTKLLHIYEHSHLFGIKIEACSLFTTFLLSSGLPNLVISWQNQQVPPSSLLQPKYTTGKTISVQIKVMQGRTCKK